MSLLSASPALIRAPESLRSSQFFCMSSTALMCMTRVKSHSRCCPAGAMVDSRGDEPARRRVAREDWGPMSALGLPASGLVMTGLRPSDSAVATSYAGLHLSLPGAFARSYSNPDRREDCRAACPIVDLLRQTRTRSRPDRHPAGQVRRTEVASVSRSARAIGLRGSPRASELSRKSSVRIPRYAIRQLSVWRRGRTGASPELKGRVDRLPLKSAALCDTTTAGRLGLILADDY